MSIECKTDLHAFYGEPSERARKKQMARLDVHCRAIIAHSPFCVVSSAGADGRADASPRGDAPGFVAVLDEHTLLIPDRPGNNRVDSFGNIMENPHVGLLFLVPGMNEMLRVNGTARIVTDDPRLAPLSAQGKAPRSGLLVEVEEVYLHCGKALIRANLWDPATRIDRSSLPSLGKMLADQIGGMDVEQTERSLEENYRTRLY
jgi:hypothetical protein